MKFTDEAEALTSLPIPISIPIPVLSYLLPNAFTCDSDPMLKVSYLQYIQQQLAIALRTLLYVLRSHSRFSNLTPSPTSAPMV